MNSGACREVVERVYEALSRGDWDDLDRWLYAGVKKCDVTPGELLEEAVQNHADYVGRQMASELIAMYASNLSAGSKKPRMEAIQYVSSKYMPFLVFLHCEALTKIAVGYVKALKLGWIGPVWPAAAIFLYLLEKKCGEVPDDVIEVLGPEEYGQYEASKEEGVALVRYPESVVKLSWKDFFTHF